MHYACEEHVELALDIVVDEEETAPNINKLTEEEQLSTVCSFCQKRATYSVQG